MSLPIQQNVPITKGLTEKFPVLAVIVTLSILGELIVKTYEGCHVTWSKDGKTLDVWAYEDGPAGHVRGQWSTVNVLGYEHVGDHEGAKAALLAQKAVTEAQRPKQPAGPDYPRTPPGTFPPRHAPLSSSAAKEFPVDIIGTSASTPMPLAPKSLTGEFPTEVVETAPKPEGADKTPTHLMARPDEAPEVRPWEPRGRPTPHRSDRPRRSGAFSAGLKAVGTAMLLGFTMLAGSESH